LKDTSAFRAAIPLPKAFPRWEGFFASEGDQKQYVLQTFWPPLGWQAVVQRLREDAATGPVASGILPAKHSCINLL
jgi:hypothetical protein